MIPGLKQSLWQQTMQDCAETGVGVKNRVVLHSVHIKMVFWQVCAVIHFKSCIYQNCVTLGFWINNN